jgi:glycyl-tRNA synthetase beta chain
VAEPLVELAVDRGLLVDADAVYRAAELAKCDLTTELVKEFTELQGEIGGLYARKQELGAVVADAIYDQYRPKSMEDRIPRTPEGQLLAIADKADTIAGMFGLGLEPTGSKDPFALRRAANGIVKILAESAVPLRLGDIVRAAVAIGDETLVKKVEVFFAERLEFYLREAKGQAYDVVKAVLAVGADDVRDAVARAEAVTAVRGSEDFAAVSAAFKRMKNILAQNLDRGPQAMTFTEPKELHPAQEELSKAADAISLQVDRLRQAKEYEKALTEIAKLRPSVDAFFDQVMVVDPDEQVRASRLRLLASIVQRFGGIAEFSEIVVAG